MIPPFSPPLLLCSMAFYLKEVMSCTHSFLLVVSGWVCRHVIGAVLVSLPAISVLSHLTSSIQLPPQVNPDIAIPDPKNAKIFWFTASKHLTHLLFEGIRRRIVTLLNSHHFREIAATAAACTTAKAATLGLILLVLQLI